MHPTDEQNPRGAVRTPLTELVGQKLDPRWLAGDDGQVAVAAFNSSI